MTPKFRTALFAGSFNPFTIGHQSIVERALRLCDRVIIGFGVNVDKGGSVSGDSYERTKTLYAANPAVEVVRYSGLTVDFAREAGVDFLIRGVRDTRDFEYERNLAEINLRISGIETVLLPSLPELSFISSSMVRELESYGHDMNEFLP